MRITNTDITIVIRSIMNLCSLCKLALVQTCVPHVTQQSAMSHMITRDGISPTAKNTNIVVRAEWFLQMDHRWGCVSALDLFTEPEDGSNCASKDKGTFGQLENTVDDDDDGERRKASSSLENLHL